MVEQILLEFNSARIKFFKWYFAAIVLIIAWAVIFFGFSGIAVPKMLNGYLYIFPMAAIFLLIVTEIRVRSKKYIMTDSRLIERNGILSKEETFLASDRIANYTVKQNFAERIFGIGNIEIESVDGDDAPEITMEEVADIGTIKAILDRQVSTTRSGARGK